MVERQFRLLLFRQPKSQFRGVVAAGVPELANRMFLNNISLLLEITGE